MHPKKYSQMTFTVTTQTYPEKKMTSYPIFWGFPDVVLDSIYGKIFFGFGAVFVLLGLWLVSGLSMDENCAGLFEPPKKSSHNYVYIHHDEDSSCPPKPTNHTPRMSTIVILGPTTWKKKNKVPSYWEIPQLCLFGFVKKKLIARFH